MAQDVKDNAVVPHDMPIEVFEKVQSELNPSPVRALSFNTLRQKNAQFLKKGLAKPGRVSFDVLRKSANSVHVARICINVLKEKVTKTKWVVKPIDPLAEVDKGRVKKIEELLKHPNRTNETFRSLMDKMCEDLLVLDAVAVEKTRYPDGELAELHYVDASTVRPVFDQFGNQDIEIPVRNKDGGMNELPVSYVQVLNNSKYGGAVSGEIVGAWPKKDFMYFHMHPQGAMEGYGYGLSPLEGVISVVSNLLNADNFNGTYFEEGSFPPIILQIMGQINQRDIQAYREYLYAELQGNFHRPAIMAGDKEAKVLNLKEFTNRDMQFMDYMKFLARLLASAYGLSAQDIGLTDDLNRATAETQKDLSDSKGYGSILHLIKEVINQEIIWKDFGYTDLEFDWVGDDSIEPEVASRIYDMSLKNGTLTLNEVREKLGEEPFPEWADEPAILTGSGFTPIDPEKKPEPPPMFGGQEPPIGEKEGEDPGKIDVVGGEKNYEDQADEEAKKSQFKKSVYTQSGFKTFVDDRGYGQPFIFYNPITGQGKVIKPPVAVNLHSQELEEKITNMLAERGLSVAVVKRMSYWDIVSNLFPSDDVLIEFDKYMMMTPEYDSEKWRAKHGGSRRYPSYQVSDFVDGYCLNNALLIADMKRDPKSYYRAIMDLAELWKVEKELVLGDRRADQYIITPQKRAVGIDYQFMGEQKRWEDTQNAIKKVLAPITELQELFLTEIQPKEGVIASALKTLKSFMGENILNTSAQGGNPELEFEKLPVMFGEMMKDEQEKERTRQVFQHDSAGLLVEEGYTEHVYTYDFNQATKALGDYLKKYPEGYGGIIKQLEERGIKYVVFVRAKPW